MKETKSRIVVIGSYAVGMTMSCARFPKSGETVKGSGFRALHGGKGSNQAIAVARLGGNAVFGSCVGNDAFGDAAVEMLRAEGIDARFVKRSDKVPTGVGFVVVDATGNNEIVIDLGANEFLFAQDMDAMKDTIANSDILLLQLETNLEAVVRAIELAHAQGVMTILNPAPFQALPDGVIRKTSIITPNETEAMEMLGLDRHTPVSGAELARRLHGHFGVTAVVTLGPDGAYIKSAETDEAVPTYEIAVRDTTGAGDTFSAALAVALGEGKDLRTSVAFANKAASHSVSLEGVVESIPTRHTVDSSDLKIKGRDRR